MRDVVVRVGIPGLRKAVCSFPIATPFLLLALTLVACGESTTGPPPSIKVSSEPPGAYVTDGVRLYGQTPTRITGLPPGEIYIQLALDGYKRRNHLVVMPAEGENEVTVKLARLVGYLSFETQPPLAKVFIDGTEYIGETPFVRAEVPVGEHTYEVRLENYWPLTETIFVEEGFSYSENHLLTPLKGKINVFSNPSGIDIWINEEKQEQRTPASFELTGGVYSISVYTRGHIEEEQVIELAPNATEELTFALKRGNVPRGMKLVPAGTFIFGETDSPDERPKREVFVDSFYIDKYEVTNQDYQEVFPLHQFEERFATVPVTGVTWEQADRYAKAVGKRLPKEVEWEKAARGTDGRSYPWGSNFDPEKLNGGPLAENRPAVVGSYRAGVSPYGVMDMSGNVLEWTSDWYEAYEGNEDVDTEYGMVFKVLRGGSYLSEDPYELRCSRRVFKKPDVVAPDFGFRCVMDATGN